MTALSRGIIPRFLSQLGPNTVTALGLLLTALTGALDHAVGVEISLVFLYLIPIAFVAWYAGAMRGTQVAMICTFVWYGIDAWLGGVPPSPMLNMVDLLSHMGFFVIVAVLLARQRMLLERERRASRTDFLTGALNRRAFIELASTEIERMRRNTRPFTITYFDLDNFKAVNDEQGHAAGDAVLCRIVNITRLHLRAIDSIARLGGDEFALLLPETSRPAAQAVVEKVIRLIQDEMDAMNWPITLSVGVLTCANTPRSVDAMLRAADRLMYQVKATGKNAILYAVCENDMQIPQRAAG